MAFGIRGVTALAAVLLAATSLAACGGSSTTDSTVSFAELHAAKRAGEEKAREQDRVRNLQKQVRSLKHQAHHRTASSSGQVGASTTITAPPPVVETSEPVRAFHVPSGNVSCEILTEGASCTVESVGETFVVEAGEPGRIESATSLPRDLGEAVGYGSTVSAGTITCEIPPSDVPRGISCSDSSSGHGFEASRVPSRQSAY